MTTLSEVQGFQALTVTESHHRKCSIFLLSMPLSISPTPIVGLASSQVRSTIEIGVNAD